jgi:integrase
MKNIKVGGTTIKIYHGESNGYPLHTVVWHSDGKRQRKCFADLDEANRHARLVLAPAIRRGELAALKLTGIDREAYVHAMELLRPIGVPLSVAVEEYVKRKAGANDRPVAAVVKELLEARSTSSSRYQESLRSHLNRFADTFHYSIGGVTTAMIVGWLDRLKLSNRGRKNARQSVVTLFHFARSRGYLPKNVPTEADDVETIKENETEIGTLTPAQLSKLLKVTDDKLALYLVLGAFTGIRSAELLKLNWSNFRSDPGFIHIDASIAKTSAQRFVPVLPNLAAWLEPYRRARGKLFKSRRMVDRLTRIAKENGIPWPNNCLRHSFASYRIAATMNTNQVAEEMGTSYAKLKKHYRKPITPEKAAAWFAIAPERPKNVVAMVG